MARNPWENVDATGVPVRQGAGFWGWIVRLIAVGGLTLAGAFYWPLFRAHKELTAEYAALNQRTEALDREVQAMKTELGSTKAKRDELMAQRGMDQSRERASREVIEQIKVDLSSKLARFVEKGTMVIALHKNLVVARFPAAVSQSATKTDVNPDARVALCTLSSAVAARGAVDLRIVSRDAGPGESDKTRTSWDLAAERSAAVARTLIDKCKYSADHVEAAVRSQAKAGEPSAAGDPKTMVDLEIDPGAGATLTAL